LGDTIRMGSDTRVRTRTCSVLIATGLRCGSVGWGAALWECRVGGCVLYLRWMAGGG
jgi:hypothetical protein